MNASITGTQANGLGMVIVGGYKEGEEFGIFVKSVRPNGPVAQDGRTHVGDQLLSVNGTSLRGVSNDQAVLLLKAGAKTDHVHLEIARNASTRSDFKRLSQVMHFNPGETPPEIRKSFPTGIERPLREHTFSFPKTLGIGLTIKAAASGPTVCIDRVIIGLDAYKDGNLQRGDILLSVNDESYEGMAVEEAQKQLSMLKTRHQVKQYTVKVAREGQEDEEEVQEEVQAVVGPGQKLESSPPLLQPEEQALGRKSEEAGVTERRQLREELATVRGQLVSCEEANEELQQTIADLREEQVQRENEFTSRLTAIEAQMRALLPPWAIPETELVVTDTVLGKGAYGEVRVGVYHGDRVAVKRLHNVIASDYYHKMIQREMGIAARLRHPKLVLFIGAVTRGNLTIVTELMETSLRSELEHGRLKEDHILSISRDVACALCYLHSLPEPIIHRDVSSANVLLNSTKGGWVAKLGDYGSANFQAKLQTVGPGCPVYAAPEASRPEEQGPKMDVYSYGVLVLEMCTGTLPDPRDLPVIQQAVHSWRQPKRQLGGLACQCTLQSSDRRPHMRNVVTQLNGM